MPRFGGPGVTFGLGNLPTNVTALQAGETYLPPSNWYRGILGPYISIQQKDPVSGMWRPKGSPGSRDSFFFADGNNIRLANLSGCAVAALLTNGGSGYTSPPTVTASAGSSSYQAIVGGAVNTTVSVQTGGTNYVYPPTVQFSAPPSPGIPATGIATISGGAVTAVTIIDQGAGYTSPPTVTFTNDPRDTTGSGATAVASLTGAGTVTGLLVNDHGNPLTSVPTLTFSGGGGSSAAATAIMQFAVTGYAVSAGGTGYTGAAGYVTASATPVPTAGSPAYTNPSSQISLVPMRPAIIAVTANGSGVLSATGGIVIDGGVYQAIPSAGSIVIMSALAPSGAATLTLTMGGVTDTAYLMPD